ncbi:23S rRNA (guanosine(2251)-2'-O)-methyltransferase RlmB [Flavobacteriales bacterium]|jgi:23S rRNA (guanosine2251-2'-O)-methyltransferase|nr:23S rRNA (guanosine(2251)-2'-O)-methyltransferase RlmB [Flavobacteriales bacterium]MDA9863612.1 23S rRNA (guanosine(2251)-2'-O)-methyltransferase RlmB [Flavobacteriales bacterium]
MNRRSRQDDDRIIGWHPIQEALDAGKELARVLLQRDAKDERTKQLVKTLRDRRIPVQRVPRERLDRITKKNHQGILAFASPISFVDLEELVQQGFESGKRVMIVVLDGVTDVGNLGAIARSAECFGATGLVVQDHHAAPVNEDAVKTSSGALLRLPVARVPDVTKALRYMGKCGLERIGLSEKAEMNITDCKRSDAACLVLGDEEHGISTASWSECDVHSTIPMSGSTGSLNVSVAAGIGLHHLLG